MHIGSRRRIRIKTLLLWAAPITWLGCGGDGGTDIVLPALSITTITTGVELDPDGYSVGVDASPSQPIGLDATLTIDQLSDGQHTVVLSGLAANCSAGSNPQTVTVNRGATATASFPVTCGATTGSITVTTATTGTGSDPDGYVLSVDGVDRGPIGVSANLTVAGLAPGAHLLGLTGLAANCQVTGDNPSSASVVAGQTTQVAFAVTCVAATPDAGTIQITTTTGGSTPDPDGYSVSVDGVTGQPIGVNATLSLLNVSAGQHAVQLLGVASNCAVTGANPVLVTVPGGAAANASFTINCVPPPPGTGSLQIAAATSGSSLDDSYTVNIDGGNPQALASNGSITIEGLGLGTHLVQLGGVAANCSVSDENPRSVIVTAAQTATTTFAVACVTPPPDNGSIVVTAATTGNALDPDGYSVQVDNGNAMPIAINGNQTFGNLPPGGHSVRLTEIAGNCTVSGENPRSVTVVAGQSATLSFAITCVATAPTLNLQISNLYLTQSTQNLAGTVPLVAGRAGYLRVFVVANQSSPVRPDVEVTFRRGGTITKRTISALSGDTPTSVQEGSLDRSWNLPVEASMIQPGLSISAEVDPGKAIPESNENDNTFPASGTGPVTVRTVSLAKFRFVPIQQGDEAPGNISNGNKDQFLEIARKIYPLNQIDADIRDPFKVAAGTLQADGTGWGQTLTDIEGARVTEGSDRTYYGVAHLDYQFGIVGLGFVGSGTASAMGTDDPVDLKRVTAHELGHTWNQLHTPCGNPGGIDPNYPYGTGIGVYGFDVAAKTLRPPSTPDIMGYCVNPWISDYIYTRVMDYRAANPIVAEAATSQKRPALLVWGHIVNGRPVLEPAFHIVTRPHLPRKSGSYSVEGIAADGTSLFSLSFDPAEVADDPSGSRHFAFAVPLDHAQAARLASLRALGPGGAAAASLSVGRANAAVRDSITVRRERDQVDVEWNPQAHPMIMVRDPDTGEVLSFARGGKARIRTSKGALDLVASDGVQSQTMRVVPR